MPEIYLKDIIQMVKDNPNDYDLGEKIRSYVNDSESESKSKSKPSAKVSKD